MKYWMVLRYLKDGKKYLSVSFVLAVLGVAIGVAALVIAMAVVSGYETTLRQSIINLQGHVQLSKHGGVGSERAETEESIQSSSPHIQNLTPFLVVEGLIAHKKKLSGILLEGVDPATVSSVLALEKGITDGKFLLTEQDGLSGVVIGKGIAKKFDVKVGDTIRLVIPISRVRTQEGFKPKVQKFYVHGILDLGRTDFDERYILTDMQSAQLFAELNNKISGWRIKVDDYTQAKNVAQLVGDKLGLSFRATSWGDMNKNLFEAVVYEKQIIFIVVVIMMIAASFNVASTLLLSVVRRYSQISILKAIGADKKFIRRLFTTQGLVIGALGAVIGIFLGLLGCRVFLWAEKKWGLFPGEVYKLDYVQLEIRMVDLSVIVLTSMFFCYLATLVPARRGANLMPVEGLRYE